MIRRRFSRSIAAKLLSAHLLVIVAGGVTLLVIAFTLGPGVFRTHVREALGFVPPDVARHLDAAFGQAIVVSLVVAVAAAVVTALGVSWFVSYRVVRPIHTLAAAAQRIAHGAYTARVPVIGVDEIATLAQTFNEMAGSLESAERKRRELLADVAHELRTPLATVEGYVEGLADGVFAPGEEVWAALRAETRRLGRLVDDLQKVSRAEERQLDLRLVETQPEELVGLAVQAAAPAYDAKGVELRTDDPGAHLPAVAVDRDRIGEVLANLLENALRHTPPGGRVAVSAVRSSDMVELAATDTGDGIAAEQLERVFERFFRVDPARSRASGGSGIGLAIARAIVEAHDGRIRAESGRIGKGSRFVITLPPASATLSTTNRES